MPTAWKKNIKSRTPYLCFFMFIAVFLIAGALTFQSEQARSKQDQERASNVLIDAAQKIKFAVETGLASTYTLEALLKQGDGEIDNFEAVAARVQALYPEIYSILLIPDGVVRKVAPLPGNEIILGHNMFENEARLYQALLNMQGLTLVGPLTLQQGQLALIGRLPVYLDYDGEPLFWGFVSVTFKFPDILAPVQLNKLASQGYAYELSHLIPERQELEVIASSGASALAQSLQQDIELPNARWVLRLAPLDGWGSGPRLVAKLTIGLLVSVFAAFLIKLLLDAVLHKQELEQLAFLDAVTGLPNRRLLLDRLNKEIAYTKRHGSLLAVAFIDLDGFKTVNDEHGHDVGDQLLHTIATRMQSLLRESDTVARIGGDEFVVVTNGWSSNKSCMRLIERLQACISEAIYVDEIKLQVTGSIGLTFYRKGDTADVDELLRQADQAMYHAKVAGKNRCQIFNITMAAA